MRRRVAIGLMALSFALPAAAKTADPCASLPKPVLGIIAMKFPGWRPKQVADLDSDARQVWQNSHPDECPGIAVGHFESSDRLSYAVLLVSQSDPNGGFKLIAFDKSAATEAYAWKLIDEWNARIYSGAVISKAPPSEYSQASDPAVSVNTMLDGVYFGLIDKGSILYYSSNGRFQKLILSAEVHTNISRESGQLLNGRVPEIG